MSQSSKSEDDEGLLFVHSGGILSASLHVLILAFYAMDAMETVL